LVDKRASVYSTNPTLPAYNPGGHRRARSGADLAIAGQQVADRTPGQKRRNLAAFQNDSHTLMTLYNFSKKESYYMMKRRSKPAQLSAALLNGVKVQGEEA
jgi:hypothetical protein